MMQYHFCKVAPMFDRSRDALAPLYLPYDYIDGTPGDDSLAGTPGTDTISGGDGDDVIRGNGDNDPLFLEVLSGDDFSAQIYLEGVADDVLSDDIIIARGRAVVANGDSSDLRILSGAYYPAESCVVVAGNDTIVGDGESQRLVGDFSNFAVIHDYDLAGGEADVHAVMGDDLIISSPIRSASLTGDVWTLGLSSIEDVLFECGDDSLVGGGRLVGDIDRFGGAVAEAEDAYLEVYGGNDLLIGVTSDDLLIGDIYEAALAPNDEVPGNSAFHAGDDTLVGMSGNDTMTGDVRYYWGLLDLDDFADRPDEITYTEGHDTFVFMDDFGDDLITDFNDKFDTLRFVGYEGATMDDLVIDRFAEGTEVSAEAIGGGTVFLLNVFAVSDLAIEFT